MSWRALALACLLIVPAAAASPYFQMTVVDDQTGRGVPLVELKTTNGIRLYTDSNGVVAFDEPGLMDRDVFFFVKSHGYEFAKDGFGMAGRILNVKPGGSAELKIKRLNIAERLYRLTGQGIYRDSVLVGRPAPIREPLINGLVMGQDSVQIALLDGRIYWFWGDTGWPRYPLGNFQATGATSRLPGDGGLDPAAGVDLAYLVDKETGFAKKMAPMPESNPVWIDALVTLPDESGKDRIYAGYARVTQSMEAIERGFIRYDTGKDLFDKIGTFDLKAPLQPAGHPLRWNDGGAEYILYPAPFPLVRTRADLKSYLDLAQYEGFTCLAEGGRVDEPQIDRDAEGRVRYAWKRNTPPLKPEEQDKLVKAGQLKPEETLLQLRDVDTGKAVIPHAGSVYWNPFRKRWVTIRCEVFGSSMLGETWYAEADSPMGPWVYARKIVTHDKYSFYNPKHHPFFDQQGGRVIYFEGTYTFTFSGATEETPRYDYNQIMYRLDLADPRLVLPVPVYQVEEGNTARLRTAGQLASAGAHAVPFFAMDRARPGLIAVCESGAAGRLQTRPADAQDAADAPLFYALPPDAKDPPATTAALYEFTHADGARRHGVEDAAVPAGFTRGPTPIARVWRSPTSLRWHVGPARQ